MDLSSHWMRGAASTSTFQPGYHVHLRVGTRYAMSRLLALGVALGGAAVHAQMQPILFMEPVGDAKQAWGLLTGFPNALARNPGLTSPPVNYTAGATVFASFTTTDPSPESFEVFVAVGRPGEPVVSSSHGACFCVLQAQFSVL